MRAHKSLRCDCWCSNCRNAAECHYSDYHCHHAQEDGFEYGRYEAKGFCAKTGFMPDHSWRRSYDGWQTTWQEHIYR